MFQKSHPNFQDVKRVDLLESQNGRVRGETLRDLPQNQNHKLPKLPRFIMKPRRHPRPVKVNIFPQFWKWYFWETLEDMGFKFQESLFWVVRPPIYLKHEVSTGWRQWSVGDHRKLVRKVNFILLGSFLLAFAIEEADSWHGTWDPGKYGRWKLEAVFWGQLKDLEKT